MCNEESRVHLHFKAEDASDLATLQVFYISFCMPESIGIFFLVFSCLLLEIERKNCNQIEKRSIFGAEFSPRQASFAEKDCKKNGGPFCLWSRIENEGKRVQRFDVFVVQNVFYFTFCCITLALYEKSI